MALLPGPGDTGTAEGERSDGASPTALGSTSLTRDDSVNAEMAQQLGPAPIQMWERQFLPKYPGCEVSTPSGVNKEAARVSAGLPLSSWSLSLNLFPRSPVLS